MVPKEEFVALIIAMTAGIVLSLMNRLTPQEVNLITYCLGAYCAGSGLKSFGNNKNGQ